MPMALQLRPLTAGDGMDDPALTGEWSAAFADYQPRAAPWCDYLALEDAEAVGSGGFKTPPDEHGCAEIGYITFLSLRGRGVATAIAATLVAKARDLGLRCVSAHTLPEENASTAVLRRNGFARVGVIDDPEDGEIWRWELRLD